jgi:hypothetical protein
LASAGSDPSVLPILPGVLALGQAIGVVEYSLASKEMNQRKILVRKGFIV